MKYFLLSAIVSLFIYSCSGSAEKKHTQLPAKSENETMVTQNETAKQEDLSSHPGLALYNQHCLPCHQADGYGVPGMNPPLVNTDYVNGDAATLVSIIVNGLNEEIEVEGEIYSQMMAPLPHLTDQEIAHILTFVRKEFGTDADEITVDEVSKLRAEVQK